jgi:hypothetical protein
MVDVMMRFIDSHRLGGDDFLVKVPRIPVKGEAVQGPDKFGWWVVREVQFIYADGLAFEPETRVVLEREAVG